MSDSLGFALAVILTAIPRRGHRYVRGVLGLLHKACARRPRLPQSRPLARRGLHHLLRGMVVASLTSTNVIIALAINLFTFVLLAFVFAFIDSTIPVVRRSDPLLRGLLHWKQVRIVLWTDLGLAAVYLAISALNPASTNSGLAGSDRLPALPASLHRGCPSRPDWGPQVERPRPSW